MKGEIILKRGRFQLGIRYSFLPVLLLLLFTGYLEEYLILYLSMALHEMGHCAAARQRGKHVRSVRILPVGLNAEIDMENGSWQEKTGIYVCGPAVNLLLALLSIIIGLLWKECPNQLYFFGTANMYLAFFNLLPVLPLDGGQILKDTLVTRLGIFKGSRYLRKISFVLACVCILVGIHQISRGLFHFSLMALGIYMVANLLVEGMEAALMNIKHVIYRRARLQKRGIYPARDLVVLKSVHMGEILKHLDFDRFHFVHVLDEDLKLIKVLTEQEVVEGMIQQNADITFGEFLGIDTASENLEGGAEN